MNYEEVLQQAQKELEELRVRKARVQEQIDNLVNSLGLDSKKPINSQLDELEKSNEEKQKQLDEQLKLLEAKFKELENESSGVEG